MAVKIKFDLGLQNLKDAMSEIPILLRIRRREILKNAKFFALFLVTVACTVGISTIVNLKISLHYQKQNFMNENLKERLSNSNLQKLNSKVKKVQNELKFLRNLRETRFYGMLSYEKLEKFGYFYSYNFRQMNYTGNIFGRDCGELKSTED